MKSLIFLTEQLSLALRYVFDGVKLRKSLQILCMLIMRITGEEVAKAILKWLTTWKLSHSGIRGQCYGGASNMAGAWSGCMAIIQQQAPMAIYFLGAFHCLNLAIVFAYNLQEFKHVESYIEEIGILAIQLKGSAYYINALSK